MKTGSTGSSLMHHMATTHTPGGGPLAGQCQVLQTSALHTSPPTPQHSIGHVLHIMAVHSCPSPLAADGNQIIIASHFPLTTASGTSAPLAPPPTPLGWGLHQSQTIYSGWPTCKPSPAYSPPSKDCNCLQAPPTAYNQTHSPQLATHSLAGCVQGQILHPAVHTRHQAKAGCAASPALC